MRILILILVIVSNLSFAAKDKMQEAIELYNSKSYSKCITIYEDLLSEKKYSSTLYYNLGNAYYKSNELGKAILNYEKALKVNPNNEDALSNLNFALKQTRDKAERNSRGIGNAVMSIITTKSRNFWANASIFLWIIGIGFIALYLLSKTGKLRKLSFYTSIPVLILACTCLSFSYIHKSYLAGKNNGIITAPVVEIKKQAKDSGELAYELHEGTKVEVLDENETWFKISFNDNIGWIRKEYLGRF